MARFAKTLCLLVLGLPFALGASTAGLALVGCSGGGQGGGTGGGGGKDGGVDGGGESDAFNLFTLDDAARELLWFSMSVDPGTERVGVAYFTPSSTTSVGGDGGTERNYDLKYVEWNNGIASAPERIRSMQRMVGLSLAFDPLSHQAVTTFLGGDPQFVVGKSIFWYQNDLAVARRTMAGTWVESDVVTTSAPPQCSPIDTGFLEGLWSSLAFDPAGKMYVAYRDGHNGQFAMQDWAASDVEVVEGANEAALGGSRRCLTGDHKEAYGGRIQLVIGKDDQPSVVYDAAFGGADTVGQNVYHQQRNPDGTWSAVHSLLTLSDTMSGASLAYDKDKEGYGLAYTDRMSSQLRYIRSTLGGPAASWSQPDDVFGVGTGGWYPSLAMDPVFHEPAIAFSVCSPAARVNETSCLQSDDEVRVSQRVGSPGTWRETLVDRGGGWAPKLKFFASGKRVVAYRTPPSRDSSGKVNPSAGQLKLAVER